MSHLSRAIFIEATRLQIIMKLFEKLFYNLDLLRDLLRAKNPWLNFNLFFCIFHDIL